MIEVHGDIWALAAEEAKIGAVAVCITTNGDVNRAGKAVMGAGIARQARERFAGDALANMVGARLLLAGNRVHGPFPISAPYALVTFPVKHRWPETADPVLIATSAEQLERLADREQWDVVLLPRPGCGSGHLDWDDVKPLLTFLDDRFWAVDR